MLRIERIELHRLETPLRRAFAHAAAQRTSVERVVVVLEGADGKRGVGEILPRPYLTGEDLDQVFDIAAQRQSEGLLGRRFADWQDVTQTINGGLESETEGPALLAGFEAALINLGEQVLGPFDFAAWLGPPRSAPAGHCATIGRPESDKTLRRLALEARLSGADVVKIKVAKAADAAYVHRLAEWLGDLPIRLDANGSLSYEDARALLAQVRGLMIDSLEQPLHRDLPNLSGQLQALEAEYGVPLMADESVCSWREAAFWVGRPGYQIFNVRIGKCGGLLGAKRVIELACAAGRKIVGGTLVGESRLLDRYGRILLHRTPEMPYMEGLGQAEWLLAADPFQQAPPSGQCWDYELPMNISFRPQTAEGCRRIKMKVVE